MDTISHIDLKGAFHLTHIVTTNRFGIKSILETFLSLCYDGMRFHIHDSMYLHSYNVIPCMMERMLKRNVVEDHSSPHPLLVYPRTNSDYLG